MEKEIEINGVTYYSQKPEKLAQNTEGLPYSIIRADRAGVFAAYVKSVDGGTVTALECRRLWYWDGAASISQIAVDGVSKPDTCKFPVCVSEMLVMGVIEIIPCTEEAKKSIDAVPIWSA